MSSTNLYILVCISSVCLGIFSYFAYPWLEEWVVKKTQSYVDWAKDISERMFRPLSTKFIALSIIVPTLLMGIGGGWLTRNFPFLCVLFTLAFGSVGFVLLRLCLSFLFNRRLSIFNEQLIDALTLMSNSLKSGLNLSQSLQIIVQEFQNPISQEFALVLSQEKIGLTLDEALEKMVERLPSQDLSVAIHSILILRETGGDLSETFDTIATTIRERKKVSGKIKAMTQQGRTQGIGLLIIPFALLFLMYFVNPPLVMPMFTTQLGWIMIGLMLILQTIG
ncbi:MAG: type II secretion system F family protein, partial [Bdellovibrionales bacterium]|nr:type II secretion system F family protein [Bdellovibrionales bacterium]